MLFMPMGEGKPIRVQGAYITDEEVERIVDFVKNQQEANYVEAMMTTDQLLQGTDEDLDEMWEEVIDFVKQRETVSISMLQRRFRIGYNRAARLVDDMEAHGIISPASGSKPRTVIIYKENQDHPSWSVGCQVAGSFSEEETKKTARLRKEVPLFFIG